jgi:hypothetical protein
MGHRQWRATQLIHDGTAFVARHPKGEPVGRLVFMHPRTPESIIDELMLSLTS